MNKEIFSQNLKRAKILGNKKLTSINHMFAGCSSLKLLPKELKWNTKIIKKQIEDHESIY